MAKPEKYYGVSAKFLKSIDSVEPYASTSALAGFAINIAIACQDQPEQRVSTSVLIKKLEELASSSSKSLLTKNGKALVSCGAAEVESVVIGGRYHDCLTLISVSHLIQHLSLKNTSTRSLGGGPQKKQLQLAIDTLQAEKKATYLDLAVNPDGSRMERLFSVLDAGMRLSGRDKRKSFSCKYHFGPGDFIDIKTSARAADGSSVALLSDERAMRAINSVLVEHLEYKYQDLSKIDPTTISAKDEIFSLDIYELCKRVGMTRASSNLDIVESMLYRLRDTSFQIDSTYSPYFREHFAPGADFMDFSYITSIWGKREQDAEGRKGRLRHYAITLHKAVLFNLIATGRNFQSHPELNSEKEGLAHRLNNWSKAYIGVRQKDRATFDYTIHEFRDLVMPSASMLIFSRYLERLMSRQCAEQVDPVTGEPLHREATPAWVKGRLSVAWLYGYYYQFDWDRRAIDEHMRRRKLKGRPSTHAPLITIWRDMDDPFVGVNSAHNKALAREASEILTSMESNSVAA